MRPAPTFPYVRGESRDVAHPGLAHASWENARACVELVSYHRVYVTGDLTVVAVPKTAMPTPLKRGIEV